MWHQFKWSNKQKTEFVKGRLKDEHGQDVLIKVTTWPFDTYGEGPDTLEKAMALMPRLLLTPLLAEKK